MLWTISRVKPAPEHWNVKKKRGLLWAIKIYPCLVVETAKEEPIALPVVVFGLPLYLPLLALWGSEWEDTEETI